VREISSLTIAYYVVILYILSVKIKNGGELIMAVSEKLIKKIMKLKNLSENNPNEHEAQEALLKMQQLMVEHGISEAVLNTESKKPEKEVVEGKATDYEKLSWYKKELAGIIANNFRCRWWMRSIRGKTAIIFFGLKEDVEVAQQVYEYALSALEYNADKYIEDRRKSEFIRNSRGIKVTYMRGFLKGLHEKFKEQVDKNGWGLILVRDELVEKKYNEMKFRKASASQVRSSGDASAYFSGYEKGKSFTMASGHIEGGK
jgi:hypothetical protein